MLLRNELKPGGSRGGRSNSIKTIHRCLQWPEHALAFVAGEVEEGAALVSRAITLDPNLAIARHWSGWVHLYLGDVDAAIEQFHVALRLSPLDPWIFSRPDRAGLCSFFRWPQ